MKASNTHLRCSVITMFLVILSYIVNISRRVCFMPICCSCWDIGKLGVQWLVWSLIPLPIYPIQCDNICKLIGAQVLWSILSVIHFVVNHPFFDQARIQKSFEGGEKTLPQIMLRWKCWKKFKFIRIINKYKPKNQT